MKITKLPDAEFEIMNSLWKGDKPMTTRGIEKLLDKKWKIQTILTLLKRLEDKGFVHSTKEGKERIFVPLIKEDDYLLFETKYFMKKYHNNSFVSLFSTFCKEDKVEEKAKEELTEWLNSEE